MKILKNFTLIGLLLAGGTPTETKPIASIIIYTGTVFLATVLYIPYVLFTRHSSARNFVEKQEDIEFYSVTLETKTRTRKTISTEAFSCSDYQTVINNAVRHAQAYVHTPGLKIIITPRIKLLRKNKLYSLCPLIKSTSLNADAFSVSLEKDLTEQFFVPTEIKNQGPITLCSLRRSVENVANKQADIMSYTITIKIKKHSVVLKEKTFTDSNYVLVITRALEYAQDEQKPALGIVFEPSIKLIKCQENVSLPRIVKASFPKNWSSLEKTLSRRFIIPIQPAMTYKKRLAISSAAFATALLTPWALLIILI